MRQDTIPTAWVSTVPATLTGRFMILAFLVILQTQLVSSVSGEVTFLNKWGSHGTGDGQFFSPWDVALSDTGQVYVVDYYKHRIQRFFDSEAWVSGTNTFVDSSVGPTSVAVGPGDILGTSLILDASKGLVVGNTTTVASGGVLSVNGGTLSTTVLFLNGDAFLNAVGDVLASISGMMTSNIVAAGTLSIGDANSYGGFNHQGSLSVGNHDVTLNTKGFACGFSGHGFKFVPVIGEALADLATIGRTELPIDLFGIDRFSSKRKFRRGR